MPLKFDRSKLVKNLATGNILGPFLDRELEKFDEPWEFVYKPKGEDDAWHPSGDCTPSVTWLYEKAKGAEQDSKDGSIRKSWMVGHFWHQWIQHVVLNKLEFCGPEAIECEGRKGWGTAAPFLTKEPAYYPYHWVRGSGDIAPLVTPKWTGIVDIKTMSSFQFKQNSLPDWAKAKYTCQMQMYMDLFDQENGMILAVNKDAPHDFKEFTFKRDQNLIDAIYTKWKYVAQCLDDGTEPTEQDNEDYGLPL